MLRVFVQKNIFELSKLSGRISWKSLVGLWIFAQWWNQWVTRKFFFSFTILLFLLSLFLTWVCIYFIDWIRSKVYLLLYADLFTPYLFTFILLFNSLQITDGSQVELGWISSPLFSSWITKSSVWNIMTTKQRLLLVWSLFHNTYNSDGYTSEYRIHSQKILL